MRIQMADLHAQYEAQKSEIDDALKGVLESCRFILGPNVSLLEEEIARENQARFGVGVASGTDAITLSLAACGVGQGDEVITTPFTFVATTESISQLGAVPVYVDIDLDTFNLDAALVESRITPRTKAILPVHLYGQMADMTALQGVADKHGLALVADGAQAIGAEHRGVSVGGWGSATTLSFFPTKNLGAYGDGGMVLTNREDIADKINSLRFHGSGGTYSYQDIGWCSRLDEIQAAVLRVKLRKLRDWTQARQRHAQIYTSMLEGSGIHVPRVIEGNTHVWHQYTIRLEQRDSLKEFLKAREMASAVYYPGALHLQPAYQRYGYREGDLPNAERACREVLSLPIHPDLPEGAVERVSEAILEFQKAGSSVKSP
ncbi:MAG: DegT/DnrJ/EryC1/StrS family aminotransferase [Armatimonadetes bacterium]|nr:DegT/DnrJ/EryC1/StrS family aminotransferase [Armatimonadota bacterium]